MLERVCSTAEPAAHALLRGFETPLRSSRVLRPYFFKNEGDHLDTPHWWPMYLESIRRVPQATKQPFDIFLTRPRKRTLSQCKRRHDTSVQIPNYDKKSEIRVQTIGQARSFGVSSQDAHQSSPGGLFEFEESDVHEAQHVQKRHELFKPETKTLPFDGTEELTRSGSSFMKPELRGVLSIPDPSRKEYDLAWKIFMNLEDQRVDAIQMFSYLAKSSHSQDLSRCMKVFALIEVKSQSIYDAAVDVLLKSFQHREAINIAVDGTIRGFDLLPRLLAHFVKNLLWGSAAELWQRNHAGRSDTFQKMYGEHRHTSEKILTERDLVEECVSMIDLPTKIVVLAERLRQHDPVYAEQRPTLQALCAQLAKTVVSSKQIMGSITGKGLLAMLDLQDQLNVGALHHNALQTLLRMAEPGARAQLALLIFRNYRFRRPDETLPRSAFGCLISICGSARYPPDVYKDILAEFRRLHGKPDEAAYQRVMTICARQGQPAAAQRYFDEYIQDHGLPTSVNLLNPLIYAYASYGDAENARKQLDRVQTEYSLISDTVSWNMLLLAHSRSADPFSAFDVFEEMSQRGIVPNEYTYGTIIGLCAIHGDIEATLMWIQRTQNAGIEINMPMLGSVVEAHLYNDQIAEAEKVAEAATASHTSDSHTRMWNSILRHCAYKADTEAILRIQQRMKTLNVRPDGMTYAALMAALVVLRRTKDAAKILRTLHLTQNLNADVFHYSILLHGFVQEGKRDEAAVIYHEMQERFPKNSVRARKSMLKLQSERSINAERFNMTPHRYMDFSQQHALEFLAKIVTNMSPSDLIPGPANSSRPRLGAHRELLAQYFDVVLATMLRDGSYDQADRLLSHFEAFSKSTSQHGNQVAEASFKLLRIKMELAMNRHEWQEVQNVWQELFTRVRNRSQSIEQIRAQRLKGEMRLQKPNDVSIQDANVQLPENLSSFSSVVPLLDDSSLQTNSILAVHRFALSRALSIYMDAMDLQLKHDDIIQLVEEDFPNAGFELDGKNWNKYVQVLAKSPRFEHRLRAFKVFEEKLLPLTPSWSLLRRGKWADESTAQGSTYAGHVKIRDKQKLNPALPYPTYFTMIYLATVVMKAHRKLEAGNGKELEDLEKYARNTLKRVQATPYLPDRIQGFLLRGREIVGNFERRPRSNAAHQEQESRTGILGSKSPLDNIPPEHMAEIETLIAPQDDIRSLLKGKEASNLSSSSVEDLRIAEQLSGQIGHSPEILPSKARFENPEERLQRVQTDEKMKLDLIQAIRKDSRRRHLVADSYRGDPPLSMHHMQQQMSTSPEPDIQSVPVQQVFAMGDDVRILHRMRPKPTSRAPSHWRMPPRPVRDTTVLKQKINPRMAEQHPLVLQPYISHHVQRQFTKNKAVRAARSKNRWRSLKDVLSTQSPEHTAGKPGLAGSREFESSGSEDNKAEISFTPFLPSR